MKKIFYLVTALFLSINLIFAQDISPTEQASVDLGIEDNEDDLIEGEH